jgi:hypothetical protein
MRSSGRLCGPVKTLRASRSWSREVIAMDLPLFDLVVLFLLALAATALVIGLVTRAFRGNRRGLGYALIVLYVVAWLVHLFTGWQEFVAEQASHGEAATVWGEDGYVWTWLARSFENVMSEFLQLGAMVVLTAILIFEGSAESKDSDDRLEGKVDAILSRLDDLQEAKPSS